MVAVPAAVTTVRVMAGLVADGGVEIWLAFVAGFGVGKDMVLLH